MKIITVFTLGLCAAALAHDTSASEHETDHHSESVSHTETIQHEPAVYVEAERGTYRSTRSDEYCEFHEEHNHIHCYEEKPTQTVYFEKETVYRSTRPSRYYSSSIDPIATGLGVGLAIGLPILIHNSIDHRYHRKNYRNRYDRHNRGYRSYRSGYRDGYKNYRRSHKRYRY